MTFTHLEDVVMAKETKDEACGKILLQCLSEAIEGERLTSGVVECAKLLNCYPENVMLCVLPEAGSENISVHIQHTLIEAFCWENDIRILKVKTSFNSKSAVDNSPSILCRPISIPNDTSCMLIEYPKGPLSSADDKLADFYDAMISGDIYPKPVIELPI
ncbi:hypothetical protein SNE40_011368 [Patella caerulea]|uniref:Growth arrest and DNA damage-inducible protein GADD45 alpha n=1 Tax=Patella caerulea TaxID=87958 RepID=A0AAN8JJJ0_PATCE